MKYLHLLGVLVLVSAAVAGHFAAQPADAQPKQADAPTRVPAVTEDSAQAAVESFAVQAVGVEDAEAEPAQVPGVADPATYLADLQALMQVQWPRNRTINIVCHGHSVPSGYFQTPTVDTFNAYPHLLHVALKERYPYAVLNVITTSIGGEHAVSGAARFERDVLSLRPDLITIDYSLNDRRAGLERSRAAWSSMIEAAQAQGIPVLLLTPTPDQRNDLFDDDDELNQHAQQVRELAAQYGVGLVDSTQAFQRYVRTEGNELPDVMAQVNHPNRAGHDLVLAELVRWFPQPPQE